MPESTHVNSLPLKTAGALVALLLAIGGPTVMIARWSGSIDGSVKQLTDQVARVADNLDKRTAQMEEMKAALSEARNAAQHASAQFDEMSAALNEAKKASQQNTVISKDTNATGKKVRVEVGSLEWRIRMLEEAHRREAEKKP